MKTAALIFLALLPFSLSAQGVRIGPNPAPADSSAGLDVDFTDRGLLPPRMTTQQRNAIVNPAAGLLVYNTSTQCLELHLPQGGWQAVLCDCQNPPNPAFRSTTLQQVQTFLFLLPRLSQEPLLLILGLFRVGPQPPQVLPTPALLGRKQAPIGCI